MKDVCITALRQVVHDDLVALYENPMENPCPVTVGDRWVSHNALCPNGFCSEAWQTLRPFVEELARGGGHFFDGWMRNPHSALLSCNDGFRPMSFLVETLED